jgi:hypothetical protein
MPNRSGIAGLVRGVREYFRIRGETTAIHLSWKARDRKDNAGPGGANRVIFIPGEFDAATGEPKALPAGRLTRDAPMNFASVDPRVGPLLWWQYPATCAVWAVDPEHPQDDERSIEFVEALVELTIQGIHNAVDPETCTPAGFANIIEWGDAAWTRPPQEAAFGKELCFGFTLLVPMLAAPVGIAYPSPVVTRDPPQ